jgi:hypothetical protein
MSITTYPVFNISKENLRYVAGANHQEVFEELTVLMGRALDADEPIPGPPLWRLSTLPPHKMLHILDYDGINGSRIAVELAIMSARSVLNLWEAEHITDKIPAQAIKVAEEYLSYLPACPMTHKWQVQAMNALNSRLVYYSERCQAIAAAYEEEARPVACIHRAASACLHLIRHVKDSYIQVHSSSTAAFEAIVLAWKAKQHVAKKTFGITSGDFVYAQEANGFINHMCRLYGVDPES